MMTEQKTPDSYHNLSRMFSLSQTDDELTPFVGMEHNLQGLPHIDESAEYFASLKVKSLFLPQWVSVYIYLN